MFLKFKEYYHIKTTGDQDLSDPLFCIKRLNIPLNDPNYILGFLIFKNKKTHPYKFVDEGGMLRCSLKKIFDNWYPVFEIFFKKTFLPYFENLIELEFL